MHDKGKLGDDAWIRIAEYAGADPKSVVIMNHLERATPEARNIWTDVLKRIAIVMLISLKFSGVSEVQNSRIYTLSDVFFEQARKLWIACKDFCRSFRYGLNPCLT
jgi:hypothetical protein